MLWTTPRAACHCIFRCAKHLYKRLCPSGLVKVCIGSILSLKLSLPLLQTLTISIHHSVCLSVCLSFSGLSTVISLSSEACHLSLLRSFSFLLHYLRSSINPLLMTFFLQITFPLFLKMILFSLMCRYVHFPSICVLQFFFICIGFSNCTIMEHKEWYA